MKSKALIKPILVPGWGHWHQEKKGTALFIWLCCFLMAGAALSAWQSGPSASLAELIPSLDEASAGGLGRWAIHQIVSFFCLFCLALTLLMAVLDAFVQPKAGSTPTTVAPAAPQEHDPDFRNLMVEMMSQPRPQALHQLEQHLKKEPDDGLAWYLRGRLHDWNEDLPQAEHAYQKAQGTLGEEWQAELDQRLSHLKTEPAAS